MHIAHYLVKREEKDLFLYLIVSANGGRVNLLQKWHYTKVPVKLPSFFVFPENEMELKWKMLKSEKIESVKNQSFVAQFHCTEGLLLLTISDGKVEVRDLELNTLSTSDSANLTQEGSMDTGSERELSKFSPSTISSSLSLNGFCLALLDDSLSVSIYTLGELVLGKKETHFDHSIEILFFFIHSFSLNAQNRGQHDGH